PNPSDGTLAPDASRKITIRLNAANAAEGNYKGTVAISSNGGDIYIPVEIIVMKPVFVSETKSVSQYELLQNYPNPFNPVTVIKFRIPESGIVILKVYDVNGREVTTPVNSYLNAGEYQLRFNAIKLSSGIYYYKINAGKFSDAKKMIHIK
ncbi:MAG: T9SS type A sorting domain-containing protein, partial [Bacillota bacterium]